LARVFSETGGMNNALDWKLPKWPFLLGDALLLVLAGVIVWHAPHPISRLEALLCVVFTTLGTVLGALPFVLEYRAFLKVVEVNALGAAVDQIQNLEKFTAQIAASTDQWTRVQEVVQGNTDKTVAGAKEIAERMAAEVREFAEFQQKMNDTERAALRLEVDKLRRGEAEWLQILVRILDHIFALHTAAVRSGQPELVEQIGNFQTACRGVTRRVGLVAFEAEADQPFDPKLHHVAGNEQPFEGALVAETAASGFTLQGKLLRPALVRLKTVTAENEVAGELPLEPTESE
jgi:molecular chaperone GrpE (heat shock protein)